MRFWLAALTMTACGRSEPEPPPMQPGLYVTTTPAEVVAETSDLLPEVDLCPSSLEGTERGHRLIRKACGIVRVSGPYYLEEGSLRLEPGATLAFADDGELVVASGGPAKLVVEGTAAEPVTFTAAGEKLAGVWRGVKLRADANRSVLNHLHLEWAGRDDDAALVIEANDVIVDGGLVRGSRGRGIVVGKDARPEKIAGVTFERIGNVPISVPPRAVGALADLTFPPESQVEVTTGTIDNQVVFPALSAPYVLPDVVRVESKSAEPARLEVAAGAEIRFGTQGFIEVGYTGSGRLDVHGTAEHPVHIAGAGSPPAPHKGIRIYQHGEAELDWLDIANGAEDGAVYLHAGRLAMRGGFVRDSQVGVQLQERAELTTLAAVRFEACRDAAIRIAAKHLAAVTQTNTFDPTGIIDVNGSVIVGDVTWKPLGAPIVVSGDIALEGRGTLTIEPGVALRMRESARLLVGFEAPASVKALGTAENPIVFGDERDDGESWGGITFYSNTRDTVMEHVRLVRVDADLGAIDARTYSETRFDHIACERCTTATLAWRCGAKVTSADISGAPATKAPDDCH